MTAPHFPTLPSSAPFAGYPLKQVDGWNPITMKMGSGHTEGRARRSFPVKLIDWYGLNLPFDDADKVMGFLNDRKGGSNYFYVDADIIPVWSPHDAPTTGSSAGGALPGDTYYVSFSWSNGSVESNDSEEATQVVAANNFLTVRVPNFPKGVTEARIYVGTVSGTRKYSGLVPTSGGIWTQEDAQTTVNGDSAAGQKILNVAAIADFQVGDTVKVNEGGPRVEVCVIAAIAAGQLTMEDVLLYLHTAAQADAVETQVDIGAAAPTTNALRGHEIKVRLRNEPTVVHHATNVWDIILNMEAQF